MAFPAMDGGAAPDAGCGAPPSPIDEEHSLPPVGTEGSPSPLHHAPFKVDGLSYVREALRGRGISAEAADLIMASWRPGTKRQYRTHIT